MTGRFTELRGSLWARLEATSRTASTRANQAATRSNATTALAVASIVIVAGAGAAAAVGTTNSGDLHITAHFQRAVGLYKGSGVRVLGVKVGKIDTITPDGTTVTVTMSVQKGITVPANAVASIIPPALVSDRYIDLPAYSSGPKMPDHGDIPLSHTQIPVEKDDIEADLNKLAVALGPQGANKNGSLSRLITVGAANLSGNGEQINQTLRDVTTLVGTLDDNKSDLTGTVDQLDNFTNFLLTNDGDIQKLYSQLATVSSQLSDDRSALASAFSNLAVATKQLDSLVRNNRVNLRGSLDGLVTVTNTLVQDKSSLEELLDDVPLALQNLAGSYDPNTQTLDVRTNTPLSDPDGLANLICTALQTAPIPASLGSTACNAAKPVATAAGGITSTLTGSSPPSLSVPTGLPALPGVGGTSTKAHS